MNGWIGVDLDGTLAFYDGWVNWNTIGEPIAPMKERVLRWVAEGKDVRIFTARVAFENDRCKVTGEHFTREQITAVIQDWLQLNGMPRLPVTHAKDFRMVELWDDRAVQVEPNTGRRVDTAMNGGLRFSVLRNANLARLPQFKNKHGGLAHTHPEGRDWSPAQWLQALTGELGEYANLRKKFERGDITAGEFLTEGAKELADVQVYLDILAYQVGVDLGRATIDKFNEVSKRVGSDIYIDAYGEAIWYLVKK